MLIFKKFEWDGYFTWRRGKRNSLLLDNRGLVRIAGQNGSGKSTMFNAMCHILYGASASKRIPASDLSGFVGSVEVFNSEHDATYIVDLSRRGKSPVIKIYKDGVDISPKKERTTDMYGFIESEIMCMTLAEFLNTVYTPQHDMHLLIDSKPKERRDFIARLFGVEDVDYMLDELNTEIKSVDKELRSSEDDEVLHKQVQADLSELDSHEDLLEKKKRLARLKSNLKEQLGTLDDQILDIAKQYSKAKTHAQLLKEVGEAKKKSTKKKLSEVKNELRNVAQLLATKKSYDSLTEKISTMEQKLANLPYAEEMSADDFKKMSNKLASLMSSLNTLSKAAKLSGKCPTCQQPISKEYAKSMSTNVSELSEKSVALKKKLSKHEKAVDINSRRKTIENSLNDAKTMLKSIESTDESTSSLLEKEHELSKEEEKLTRLLTIFGQLEDLGDVGDLKKLRASGVELEKNRELLQSELDDVMSALGETTSLINALEKKLADLSRLERRIEIANPLKESRLIYSTLSTVLGRRKIEILNDATNALASRLPKHLEVLFPEPNIVFNLECTNRTFTFDVERYKNRRDGDREKYDVSTFSGGEKSRLSLAIQMTLHDISRTTKTNLLILDEPDKHLDEDGKDGLISKLQELRGKKGTVIVTSHSTGLAEADLYDATYEIRRKKGTSRLVPTTGGY